jgi:hypothetical protein
MHWALWSRSCANAPSAEQDGSAGTATPVSFSTKTRPSHQFDGMHTCCVGMFWARVWPFCWDRVTYGGRLAHFAARGEEAWNDMPRNSAVFCAGLLMITRQSAQNPDKEMGSGALFAIGGGASGGRVQFLAAAPDDERGRARFLGRVDRRAGLGAVSGPGRAPAGPRLGHGGGEVGPGAIRRARRFRRLFRRR